MQAAVLPTPKPSEKSRKPSPEPIANPWQDCAGMWRENPDMDEFTRQVAKLRKERDEEEGKAS